MKERTRKGPQRGSGGEAGAGGGVGETHHFSGPVMGGLLLARGPESGLGDRYVPHGRPPGPRTPSSFGF